MKPLTEQLQNNINTILIYKTTDIAAHEVITCTAILQLLPGVRVLSSVAAQMAYCYCSVLGQ
jgi:hypothetical protein